MAEHRQAIRPWHESMIADRHASREPFPHRRPARAGKRRIEQSDSPFCPLGQDISRSESPNQGLQTVEQVSLPLSWLVPQLQQLSQDAMASQRILQ